MDRFEIQQAFTVLKVHCDTFIRDPNVNNARKISETVANISDKVIQDLQEYILFPIITHLLNEEISKTIKEALVRTMNDVLLKSRITSLKDFTRLYGCLLIQIYDKNKKTMVIENHEELKEAVLLCLKTLVHRCFTEVIESLYVRENASKIGQAILLSITIARTEKSRSLRMVAIEAVMALCQIDEEADRSDIILQDQVADIIMLYLPGVASGLQEIALGSEIQGHKVTVMALKAWSRVISLVMKDTSDEDSGPSWDSLMKINVNKAIDPLGTSLHLKNRKDLEKHLENTKRNAEWFAAAATKLNILVQALDPLRKHSHYKVRKEFAQSIHLLLITCSRNMKPNIMLLIEYLISLSEDDAIEVSEEARNALNAINETYTQNRNMRPLIELLEENFYNLLTKLPRIIRMSDDNEQLSSLNQVFGYLKLLGEQRLPHIMMSTSHIRRLLLALVYVSEIDCSNISLLQVVNVKDLDDPAYSHGTHLWRRFKFLENNSCKEKVVMICKFLGEFGDLRILVDSIFGLMSDAPQHKKELILLLNWMIHGASSFSIYKEVVDYYISSELWYPPIEVNDNVSLRDAQSNVVQCCLLLEGLGVIAQHLKHDYETFILKTLYLIIERAGSGHSLISFVGIKTLEDIAESQGHKTVGDLLRANIDYFSYHVTVKLRRVERNPGVLDVVGVVMKYSTMDVLPCLREIVEDVLLQLNNNFQKKNSPAFLKVFYTFVLCIKNMAIPKEKTLTEEKNTTDKSESSKIIESLLEYHEAKKIDEKIEEDVSDSELDIDDIENKMKDQCEDYLEYPEQEEEKAPDLPPYVKMVEDVMKHCLHFLPSKDLQKSLIAMLTLQEGLTILAEWENQLLPIVHLLWHPLVDRFHDENVLLINRAWQLLNVLACVSKDFIRSRTLKQVLPALSKFLTNSAKESYNKSSESSYKFTQIYKLQKELLSTLAQIVKDLKLHERELWEVLSIAQLYLNKNQNPILQDCAVQLYKDIADYNGDIPWVKCLSIWNSNISKIASDATFKIEDLKNCETNLGTDYYKNVQIIIKYIQDKNAT